MDVTCDRCKAEYEFDEALLGERGTTVKCSACGHIFRVLPPDRDAVRAPLRVRFAADGSVRGLGSLRELQQLIRAGEVDIEDELGRDGFPFRPLSDIPELKNFFLDRARAVGTLASNPPPYEPAPEEEAEEEDPVAQVAPESMSPPDDFEERTTLESTRPAAPRARNEKGNTIPAPAGAPPEQRQRDFGHGTISGLGEMKLPPPAPKPESTGKRKSFAPPAPVEPAEGSAANPHTNKLPPPGTGTVAGLSGLRPHQTLYGTPSGLPSPQPPSDGMGAGSTHPMANRASERPPSGQHPTQGGDAARNAARPSMGRVEDVKLPKPPDDAASYQPQFRAVPSPRPPAPSASEAPHVRKLYLDSSEPPSQRNGEGSRAWLYVALLLLAAAGGGWFGMTRLRVLGKGTPTLQPAPSLANLPREDEDAAVVTPSVEGNRDAFDRGAPEATDESAAAPFAPPIPDIEEELARRTGERPVSRTPERPLDKAVATPEPQPVVESPKPAPVVAAPKPVEAAKPPEATKPEAPKPAAKPVVAASAVEGDKPIKNDKLSRAERAIAINPKDYSAHLNRADALFAKGDLPTATEGYRNALAIRPSGSEANTGLGFALLKDGKASEALPYFDRAAESGYAEASIGLGDAYRSLGQPSAAKEAYQAYLDRLPSGARADYARTWLDKLSGGGAKAPGRASDTYRPAGELNTP